MNADDGSRYTLLFRQMFSEVCTRQRIGIVYFTEFFYFKNLFKSFLLNIILQYKCNKTLFLLFFTMRHDPSQSNVDNLNNVRRDASRHFRKKNKTYLKAKTEDTKEPLVPEPSASDVELAIEKLKSHKSPGIDQIPAELIKTGGKTILCEIHKLIISIWNKEELPEEWKELIILPIYKKGDKTDCSNYRGISLFPTTYKILSNILLSRLTPYAEEIIGDHQSGLRRNRSTTDHIFCIRQIL